jgi:hypothetical protein
MTVPQHPLPGPPRPPIVIDGREFANVRQYRRWRRECHTKVPYLSQMLAENAATLHAWDGREGMEAYKCSWCPDHHVGHAPGSGPKPPRNWRPRPRRFGAKDASI